jgi:phenylalanyl-tRNA synthetase beta chain
LALAGVMGGGESGIGPGTERVLLECAYFDPPGIRRAARRHGIHTESSHRFERGVDWGDTRAALDRASSLVAALARATPLKEARIFEALPLARRAVAMRHERLCRLVGADVDPDEARAILGRLGFAAQSSKPGVEAWEVPTFRPDVSREVDLIEEVTRVRGLEKIPTTLPAIRPSRDAAPRESLARRARAAGVALGLSEAMTLAFENPRDLDVVGAPAPAVVLRNPLTEDRSVMRTSLLPGLLRALAHARRHGERDVRLFAVGAVFLASDGPLPDERLSFAALLAGERHGWLSRPEAIDVWDGKGLAEGFVSRMLRREPTVRLAGADEARSRSLHPRGAGWIEVEGKRVGFLGPLHPDVADSFDIGDGAAVVVEVDLVALDAAGVRSIRFAPLPRFPSSTRDLAVVVVDDVVAGDVELAAREAAGELAEHVALFDRFTGGSVPQGHSSLALHVVYRAPDRTLTDAEVDAAHARVVASVQKRFGATLRS